MRYFALLLLVSAASASFELSVVHFNDFHARFDEQSATAGVCKETDVCHGGFARLYTRVHEVLSLRKNAILLNAGDNFQGTLWYNVFKWSAIVYFMNLLPITAYTLGNHEFDDGVEGVVPMLENMRAPCVLTNVDDSKVPEMQGLCKKSIVVEVGGRKIGIVGALISSTPELSNTEELIFLDESESVNAEADRLVKEEGVFTVIVLSHCGYDREMEIARKASKSISLVVGGHSHSMLYTGTPPDGSTAQGDYPTIIHRNIDNKKVLVVQASSYTRYLGDIVVNYDDEGDVISHKGVPVYIGTDVEKDGEILHHIEPFKRVIDKVGAEYYGETKVHLEKETCYDDECNLGNLITDAMVYSYERESEDGTWTDAALAIMNAGGIRTAIPVGNITYNDISTAQPFGNTFDIAELQGKYIKECLEYCTMPFYYYENNNRIDRGLNMMQLSGFKVEFNISNPENSRVQRVRVRSRVDRNVYEDLDLEKYYPIVIPSYVGGGGDGFTMISDNVKNYTQGPLDLAVFKEYFRKISPITCEKEDRITFV